MPSQDSLRARAAELRETVETLRGGVGINENQVAMIKASVLSELLPVIADLQDQISVFAIADDPADTGIREIVERNHKMRMASHAGEWDKVTNIANEYANRAASRNGVTEQVGGE